MSASAPDDSDKQLQYEKRCRDILEAIYKRPFPTVRPDFLSNPKTGNNLELDGYCEELKIAFEYNGIQHYCFPNWAHKTKEEFVGQLQRDAYKMRKCRENDVYLIVIPYHVPKDVIYDFIVYLLPENVKKRIQKAKEEGKKPEYVLPGFHMK